MGGRAVLSNLSDCQVVNGERNQAGLGHSVCDLSRPVFYMGRIVRVSYIGNFLFN